MSSGDSSIFKILKLYLQVSKKLKTILDFVNDISDKHAIAM
jgi:hypothetical protein